MKPDGDLAIVIRMSYGKTQQEIEIDFKMTDVLPVLQQFCSENNIQIPSQGKKFVRCDTDTLSLITVCEI